MNSVGIIIGILNEGFIYAIVSFGVYITYRILDFPDMTVDGSFPLGMSITAILLIHDINPIITLIVSFLIGVVAGTITGIIHVKLKVRDLLSGIIMMIALYSINLSIAGRPNLPFYDKPSLFKNEFTKNLIFHYDKGIVTLVILTIVVVLCKILLDEYLKTKSGYILRSVGDNEAVVTSFAVDKGNIKILGLAIANGFVAFAGSMYAHNREYFEISAGTGTLVIAVSNVIIGMQIMKRMSFMKPTTAVIIGSILYRAIISYAMGIGIEPKNLKLVTAIILLIILVSNNIGKKSIKTVKG